MKHRVAISIVALAMGLMTTAVIAQSDAITTRMGLMKQNNDHATAVVRMVRGQAPFDSAKVEAAFDQWADTARKLPGLFPPDSKTGQKTRATPKIWETKGDFDAKAAAFAKVVAENKAKAVASLDGLKAGLRPVGDACDNCHKDYRVPEKK